LDLRDLDFKDLVLRNSDLRDFYIQKDLVLRNLDSKDLALRNMGLMTYI